MIRRAIQKDSKQIASLIISGWQTTYKGLIDDNYLNGMSLEVNEKRWEENINSQNEGDKIYVYEENNQILGIIRFGSLEDKENKEYNAEIHVLYVKPNSKRKGIGSKLFEFAKNDFLSKDKKNLIIWCLKGNNQGLSFYKKMGGTIVSTRETVINNLTVEEIGLEFNLKEEKDMLQKC